MKRIISGGPTIHPEGPCCLFGDLFRFSWRGALWSFCATITLALGTHPVRGKGRSPPDLQSIFANLLSAPCADSGHSMKGGRCDRIHRRAPVPSRPTQSPTSEGPSQEPA